MPCRSKLHSFCLKTYNNDNFEYKVIIHFSFNTLLFNIDNKEITKIMINDFFSNTIIKQNMKTRTGEICGGDCPLLNSDITPLPLFSFLSILLSTLNQGNTDSTI